MFLKTFQGIRNILCVNIEQNIKVKIYSIDVPRRDTFPYNFILYIAVFFNYRILKKIGKIKLLLLFNF